MTLYIRLLLVIIKSFFCKRIPWLSPSRLVFMVWPWDCDINIHLNNARYLSLMDLARTYWGAQTGLNRVVLKKRWNGVAAASEMIFIRPLNPFQVFHIETKLIYWDESYAYLEQRFLSKKGLHANALIKAVILSRGKKVPVQKVLDLLNIKEPAPPMPESIKHWQAMTQAKKSTT